MSPYLRPEYQNEVRIRLRFYELEFQALGRNEAQLLAPSEGRFREGAVGFPARVGDTNGEASLFLWTDSDTYLMWAREAFGWPVVKAEIELQGPIWSAAELEGTSGGARLRDPWGTAAIVEAHVIQHVGSGSPAGVWLTPRRVLRRAGLDEDARELLVVRPAVRLPGARYRAEGRIAIDFAPGHPLHGLNAAEAELDVVDGFELIVGGDVEVL